MILHPFFKIRVGFGKPCADRCDAEDRAGGWVAPRFLTNQLHFSLIPVCNLSSFEPVLLLLSPFPFTPHGLVLLLLIL
jgi:hypothetical protein